MDIVVCGIPRSGSTLVWQILREVFPDQLIGKTHLCTRKPEVVPVATIRDPHDVVASLYRVRLSRGGEGAGSQEGLENVLRLAQKHFEVFPQLLVGSYLLLRYEQFFNNHQIIYDGILKTFGTCVSPEDRERIDTKCSLEANRIRASHLKDFNEMDENFIHGDHIGPAPEPGSWMTMLPDWAVGRVKEVCGPIAEEWNYAN